jgi:hypothetical protein
MGLTRRGNWTYMSGWRLSAAGIERLEEIRAGGGFIMSVGVRYGLLGGLGALDWREPHRPVRVPYPTSQYRSSSRPTTGRRTSWNRCSRRWQS